MPNHVANRITFSAKSKEEMNELVNFVHEEYEREPTEWEKRMDSYVPGTLIKEEYEFSLNKIVPMPSVLEDTQPWTAKTLTGLATNILHENPKATLKYIDSVISASTEGTRAEKKQAKKNIRLIKKWGFDSWYEWRVFNWGTKWNAYDIEMTTNSDTSVTFHFSTAWAAPIACYRKLASMFPNIHFEVFWADEDWGCNTGHAWNDEDGFDMYIPDNESDDAFDILFELDDYAREYFIRQDGRWVYRDPDDYEDDSEPGAENVEITSVK